MSKDQQSKQKFLRSKAIDYIKGKIDTIIYLSYFSKCKFHDEYSKHIGWVYCPICGKVLNC